MLAGKCFGMKSNLIVELVQKGKGSPSIWNVDDGGDIRPTDVEKIDIERGKDVAIVLSITRNALPDAQDYIMSELSEVGQILHFSPREGFGFQSITSGKHASNFVKY